MCYKEWKNPHLIETRRGDSINDWLEGESLSCPLVGNGLHFALLYIHELENNLRGGAEGRILLYIHLGGEKQIFSINKHGDT